MKMSILIMLLGVLLLFFLIIKFKLNTFVSLLLVSIVVGLLLGIPWTKVPTVVEQGIGDQVGHLAIIFGLGAMLGTDFRFGCRLPDCQHLYGAVWSQVY